MTPLDHDDDGENIICESGIDVPQWRNRRLTATAFGAWICVLSGDESSLSLADDHSYVQLFLRRFLRKYLNLRVRYHLQNESEGFASHLYTLGLQHRAFIRRSSFTRLKLSKNGTYRN